MKTQNWFNRKALRLALGLALVAFCAGLPSMAQTTISTGSIQGTITDPTGGVVPGAQITISNKARGQSISLTSSGSGTYTSGALLPGDYVVRVEAKGFKTVELPVTVQVGVTTNGNVALQIGAETAVVEVQSSPLLVSTEQATIQGVMTPEQIEQLPINGRNFLDLAQLEPGVQIQDGGNFDPTKNGFSSISFGGRFGRTARIEVDGIDISDETVGTTTQNIPASAIQEFQIQQSTLDLSTELTSSGSVNVDTRSGTNAYHGEGFGFGRWHNTAARIAPTDLFFRREQFGARVGGPILRNKLFFFLDWERNRQDLLFPVQLTDPFTGLSGGFNSPFKEHEALARLDWEIKPNVRAFYRFTYNKNINVAAFIPNTYSPFANRDNTPVEAAGVDFTTGTFTHTVRFGYTRFNNAIADAVSGTNIINLAPQIELAIGSSTSCLAAGADAFCSGPNILAPQATLQRNLQLKYDGSKVYRSHIIRYGVGVNRILGGGFAKFFGIAPAVRASFNTTTRAFANTTNTFGGGDTNPLNYPVRRVFLGNGQGFFTEIPQLGFPAGGQFDTRFAWYIGDAWKAKPNLTVNYGLRYVRDTGRSDSDLAPIDVLNQFGPGLGNRVHQPNKNFAPQLGIAWDPSKTGRTVIRAGAGLFYENAVFNNILFDRPGRLAKGLFFGTASPCPSGTLVLPDGTVLTSFQGLDIGTQICGQPIGRVAGVIAAMQTYYQQQTVAAGPQSNGSYIVNTLAEGVDSTGNQLISPDYRTPLSWQFNAGVQREIRPGTVLSVDYLRNVGLHFLLAYDTNHVGDARFFNNAAALNAINLTNASFTEANGVTPCPPGTAGINCAIAAGASIVDYAGNGLDSGNSYLSGLPASLNGLTSDTGAAFPGINPNIGQNQMLFPIGRSVYNALQVSVRQNLQNPVPGVKRFSLVASYALSRFKSQAQDQDFINNATDFANINRFFGPNGLDRTHQLSFGGVMDFPYAFRVSFGSHIATALPQTLILPSTGAPGDIFVTDITGDGTVGDVLPGTNIGSFGRDVKVNQLNNVISAYNSKLGGTLTPVGQELVSAGLFSPTQLAQLGALTPTLALAPKGEVGIDSLITFDLRLAWVFKPVKGLESFTIEPNITMFNLFNNQNFDRPGQPLGGELNGGAGFVNGTTQSQRTNRTTLGTGVFGFGAPRMVEWGMRITF
jgi:hypothetical protein